MGAQTGNAPLAELSDRWLARIGFASSSGDVVELTREYVEELTEADRMRLPSSLLPPPMKSPQDVNDYALTLTRARLGFKGPLATGVLIGRLTVFFATVSGRLAQLESAKAGV